MSKIKWNAELWLLWSLIFEKWYMWYYSLTSTTLVLLQLRSYTLIKMAFLVAWVFQMSFFSLLIAILSILMQTVSLVGLFGFGFGIFLIHSSFILCWWDGWQCIHKTIIFCGIWGGVLQSMLYSAARLKFKCRQAVPLPTVSLSLSFKWIMTLTPAAGCFQICWWKILFGIVLKLKYLFKDWSVKLSLKLIWLFL